jgi:hypothetical protein
MTHVLIVSLSRSGGKLLRMLLDGHPDLNTLPYEHWNRPSKNDMPTRRMAALATVSEDQRLAIAGAAQVEAKLQRIHAKEMVARVMNAWRRETAEATTLPDMYRGLARAYFPAIGRAAEAPVVNHCGSLCRFKRVELDNVYGAGTHVVTIRDPRAVFTSMQGLLALKFTPERIDKGEVSASRLERHRKKLGTPGSPSGYLKEFCESYRHMVADYATSPEVVRLRFEDLVTSPEQVMRKFAERLGIGWNESLLHPTQLGHSHQANSSFARQGAAIHESAADDWMGRAEPSTCSYIEEALGPEMAALGYRRLDGTRRTTLDSAPLLS